MQEEEYPSFPTSDTIRDVLRVVIGQRLVDVTRNDKDEEEKYIMLMFENGSWLKIPVKEKALTVSSFQNSKPL